MRTAKMTFAQHSFFLILIVLFSTVGIAQQNDDTEKLIKEANAYMNQAQEALSENDFAGAEAAYRKAIAKDPSNTTAKYNMGNLYYNSEKSGESQSRFVEANKVSESKEDRHRINHNLGNSFMKQKKYKQAVEAYKNALRNDPTDDQTRYNLALAKKKLEEEQQQNKDNNDNQDNKDNKDQNEDQKDQDQDNQGDKGEDKDQDGKPKDVTIVVNAKDYDRVISEMQNNNGSTTYKTRFDLAIAAYEHTAQYDGMIANYFGKMVPDYTEEAAEETKFPRTINMQFTKKQDMRYGENSHQDAAFYVENDLTEASVATAVQLQGKALSYNNIADTDAALECVKEFDVPACVIVKHANPCGVSIGDNILEAYDRAFKTDPTSAFGGIIAFNKELDADTAEAIVSRQFVEVIIAPKVSEAAAQIVSAKQNVRLLECGEWSGNATGHDIKRVNGGILVQDRDLGMVTQGDLKVVSKRQPTEQELKDLLFCWKVAKFVKSNAIVYARDGMTIGVGAGQMSRVYSAKIAGIKAADENLEVKGSVMASDAFFPFRDGIDAAAEAGITAVIQPGGSMRDEEVIAAADEAGMAMVFTGMRHFRH